MNLVGAHIGNYVVQRELGSGGMGTVYLAEHPRIGRKVAIKVLHDEHAADAETVARFFQEAKSAAEVGHENIIEVIDFGEIEVSGWKVVYLMMEALEGESLAKRLRAGPMPLDEVRHVALQACSALAACHAKGIIHRDLKPENIHLCPRSSDPMFVKVLDFGIAKLTGPSQASHRTRIGTVLGTPAYMSPEQCGGTGDIDARSDVYAMGIVLYEMLTGGTPFEGNLADILNGHLREPPPPPSTRRPELPPAWDAIVLHCLEKERDARLPSMDALAAALKDPDGHAAAYAEERAHRAARPHRTAILTPEERVRSGLPLLEPLPPPGTAPEMPPPLPFAVPTPPGGPVHATPAPFAAPTTPLGYAATFVATPLPGTIHPTPAPPHATPTPWIVPPTVHPESPTIHVTPSPMRVPEGTPPPFVVPPHVAAELTPDALAASAAVTERAAPTPTPTPMPAPIPTPYPAAVSISEPTPYPPLTIPTIPGEAPPSPRRGGPMIAGAALAAAGMIAAALWLGTRRSAAVLPDAAPATAPAVVADAAPAAITPADAAPAAIAPAPADAAVAMVRITVDSDPPGARVRGNDAGRAIDATAPLTIERPRDAPALVLTFSLAGRADVSRTIAPAHDTDLLVVLPAAATPRTPARPRTPVKDRDRLLPPE